MSKQTKIVFLIGFFVILLIVGLGTYWYLALNAPEKAVKAQIADMQTKGRPVSIDNLKSVSFPNDQNGAVVYERIFSRLGPNMQRDSASLTRISMPGDRQQNPTLWSENERIVARYRSIIPLIEQAASKPECSFIYTWTADPTQHNHYLAPLRFLNRLLCSMAVLDAEKGQTSQSLRCIELAFKVAESLNQEPSVIGQITRQSRVIASSHALRAVIYNSDMNEYDLRHLYDVLSKIDLYPGLETALIGDTAAGITDFENLLAPMKSGLVPILPLFERNKTYQNESYFIEYMNICIDNAHISYREMHGKQIDFPKPPKDHLLSDLVMPTLGGIWGQRDTATAELNGSQIVLALKVYKSGYGTYPSSLGELCNKLGGRLPQDPFSGTNFIYINNGNGFILYSIGKNLVDDGGKSFDPKVCGSRKNTDIVWQMER
jgi:hypothetical protein